MAVYSSSFHISTKTKIDLINITPRIESILSESKIENGMMNLFVTHTTAGLLINEDESRLVTDLKVAMKNIISWEEKYAHNSIDSNAPSHIVSTFLGCSLVIPVKKSSLVLGTWQSVFFAELDGPRTRKVEIMVIGE